MLTMTNCENVNLADKTEAEIDARIDRLYAFPTSIHDALTNDPFCGCGEDGEGGKCAWDDVNALEDYAFEIWGAK